MSFYKTAICYIFFNVIFASNEFDSNVTLLTTTNFHSLVNNENIWVVYFFSFNINKDQNFANEFALSADVLKGIVKFGSMDIGEDIEVAKNFAVNIRALPVVKIYGLTDNGSSIDYNGPKNAEYLVESVLMNIMENAKNKLKTKSNQNAIVEVNDGNFNEIIKNSKEPWMVLFHAPWCIHCKEIKPIWIMVAVSLQNVVKFASIDATVNKIKAKEYGITGYPTIKLFPFENKSPMYTFQYNQERTVNNIIEWVLEKLPGPDVEQITNPETFQKHCMQRSLCIISILPSLYDCQAYCRRLYLYILKDLGEKFKRQSWGWMWTEAGAQEELESLLDVGGSGYPALVALNPVKMKYSVFRGAFTKNRIDEFLTRLANTKAVGVEDDIVDKIVTVESWDGEDSVYELPSELYLYDPEFVDKDEL